MAVDPCEAPGVAWKCGHGSMRVTLWFGIGWNYLIVKATALGHQEEFLHRKAGQAMEKLPGEGVKSPSLEVSKDRPGCCLLCST